MSGILCLIYFGTLIVLRSEAARILAIVPSPSYSHQTVYRPLWKELSMRGHQVTLLTTNPMDDPSLTNLTEIDLSSSYEILSKDLPNIIFDQKSMVGCMQGVFSIFLNIVEHQLQHADVKKLIRNESEAFDLVISEIFVFPMLAFGQRFNCPVIGVNSGQINIMNIKKVGNPTHPLVFLEFCNPFGEKLNFMERLFTVFSGIAIDAMFEYSIIPAADKIVKKHFGEHYLPVDNILKNVNLIFSNTDFVFQAPKPFLPNVVQIGGGFHITPPKALPKDLQQLLGESKNGFVYFSLGGNVRSSDLPNATLEVIFDVFAELPYTVLWKFEQEELPRKPDNVYISKWFPQQDVLRHPKIRVFITHGGQQSLDEAIHSHVPIVGIPFFVDQPGNIKKMVARGCGLQIDFETIEKETFKDTILGVINNPKYRDRITELAELVMDQPISGLEKAVWWTEYVIRHKGAGHLRSPVIDIPWYQYYLLDIAGFCLIVLVVVCYLLVRATKLIYKLVKGALHGFKTKVKIH